MALQDFFDPSIEAFDHSIGLWGFRRCQTVLDIQVSAKLVERVRAGCRTLAKAKEATGPLLPVVCQDRADMDRASSFKVTQKPSGISCGLIVVDADKNPSGRAINGCEEVAALRFILHLRQVSHVDVDVAGLIGFEGVMLWLGGFGLGAFAFMSRKLPTP